MRFEEKIRSGNYTHSDVEEMLNWFDVARANEKMLEMERDNAEKREYEVLGRANALEAELKATNKRLDISDELLREEFAQKQDALARLRDLGEALTPSDMVDATVTPNDSR